MCKIVIKNLVKTFSDSSSIKIALNNINLNIPEGSMFCIMGSSGSGKSTLLKILGGIEMPTSGEIYIAEKNISKFTLKDYDTYRQNSIGYIFQDYNLLEGLTLKENIILSLAIQNTSKSLISSKYKEVIKLIDISNCENNFPEQSSGGEQQRAAICRAIIKAPQIILADEPTGSLDNGNTKNILEVLTLINRSLKTTIIVVTHDAIVASHCDVVAFIEGGKVYDTIYKKSSKQMFYNSIVETSSKARGIL